MTQPKEALDAANQTDGFERNGESCQTDNLVRKDFQIQACVLQQSEPIATQTDISPKYDFQVQANIPRENHSIAVQTIKQVIVIPNLPSSAAKTPAKKRKLLPKITQNDIRGKKVNNEQANVGATVSDSLAPQSMSNGTGDRLNDNQASLDDSILNSEVYKIYTRNDPKEAMKQIKKLKNCISFEESKEPFHCKDVKRSCEKILDNLWKIEPRVNEFEKIQKYIESKDRRYRICGIRERNDVFSCFTTIRMLNPNGYEYWYVANFQKGPGLSKWHRAESVKWGVDERLAQLNVMGITKTLLDRFFKTILEKIPWFDFAFGIVKSDLSQLFRDYIFPCHAFDVEEVKITDTTIEVNATFRISSMSVTEMVYHGKSTCQFFHEKETMEKEAKKAALMEFFKERFGFTEFNDLRVDELHRPMVL